MNWKYLDWTRRNSSPLEVDLIEHYAAGKISRRDFVKRGTMIGLGSTAMAGVIAACGSDSPATDADGTTDEGGETTAAPSGQSGGIMVIAMQEASGGLDPVNMLDFASYAHIAQSFEFLVGSDELGGSIADTGLATAWAANDALDVWTFDLRPGVKWHSGGDLTSADVAATMDRLVEAENAGLAGVIDTGSVDASDPTKAVFQLINANGNFPALVSMFNSQSGITPADYELGTLLPDRPDGTGPFMLESYDGAEVAKYVRNPNWWGGEVPLDGIELRQFASIDTQVTALLAGDIDMVSDFDVLAGEQLLSDDSMTILTPPSAAHRQVWFNTANPNSQFTDVNLRKAIALSVDREQIIQALYKGRATIGNDHPVLSTLPFFDPDAVPQRDKDIDAAKEALAAAGVDSIDTVINVGDNQEIPDMAQLMSASAREAGINFTVNTTPQADFYSDSWCPESGEGEVFCYNSDEFGIVDWGHRPTPDVFLTSALQSGTIWNASAYQNTTYDALVTDYQVAADVEAQKAAISKIQTHLYDEVPALYLNFREYLGAHGPRVTGARITSLGQPLVGKASIV